MIEVFVSTLALFGDKGRVCTAAHKKLVPHTSKCFVPEQVQVENDGQQPT